MTALLADVRVLDLSSVGPAARAAGWLADYGADVVKVAPVTARAGVQIIPPPHAYSAGRGTRRIRVDLKSDDGRDAFLRLAENVDVVIESFRPGVVARLGIGYDDVKSRNARIVYCSTTGFGQEGERAEWAGHDLNYLAVGGYLANTEPLPEGKPPAPGATVADSAAGGMQAVVAILAALVGRATTGEGRYLDVNVADGVLALMALQVDEHLATGAEIAPGTAPLRGRYACYYMYSTSDGKWLSVAAIEAKFWANLCEAVGLQDSIDRQYDDESQPAIRRRLEATFVTGTRDDWVRRLADLETCVAPVLTVAEAAKDAADRGRVSTAQHPVAGALPQLSPLLAGTERAAAYDVPDPADTDTDEVLHAAGWSGAEIATLRDAGVGE